MIYCVVPPELADELFDKLTAYYAHDDGVTVIVDRRRGDRRARVRRDGRANEAGDANGSGTRAHARLVRDRRQRSVGDRLPLPKFDDAAGA